MEQNYLLILYVSALALTILCCILQFFSYKAREKRLHDRLLEMLDQAAAGTFADRQLNETPMSALENSLWRYLCDNQTAYQEIRLQKESMQQLISDLAHQAATPVSNIMLYAQLLTENALQTDDGQAELTEAVQVIASQIEELDFFIQALVKLSRLETGIICVHPKRQELDSVLSAVKQQFIRKASDKQIHFEVESSKQQALFDRKWTLEAISNLVDNAIKYTPEGGAVAVRVQVYTIFLRIDVSDTGIGIAEEEQGSIFTRFYRTAAVSDEKGVGIGLYLAREVAKAQGGYIKVTSRPGQGSTFSFFLQT